MKNRFIPFGYQIKDGKAQLQPIESQAVYKIFTAYVDGLSLKTIAERLTNDKVEYLPDKYDWNKNRVKRILEDERYLGSDTYSRIISEDLYTKAQMVKYNRNAQKHIDWDNHISLIGVPFICCQCGKTLKRKPDRHRKGYALWRCSNEDCDYKAKIGDAELIENIKKVLNCIIENPNLIETDSMQESCCTSLEVTRLSNEISRTLEGFDFDKEKLKNMIFQCAAEKYKNIKNSRYITDILKNEFVKQTRSSDFNKELFDKTVSHIKLGKDSIACLILKNGKSIGTEAE